MEQKKEVFFGKHRNAKVFIISFIGFVIAFGGITASVILIYNNGKNKQTVSSAISSSNTGYTPAKGDSFNIMVIGFGAIADEDVKSVQLVRVDPLKGALPIVSIPVNTMTQTGGKIRSISECFKEGKIDLTRQAVEDLTNVKIDYYILMDLYGFKSLIESIKNIEFTLSRDIYYTDNTDPLKPIIYDLKKGKNVLDGAKAVVVARFPQYARGDVERGNIHAQIIKALITQKFKVDSFTDAVKFYAKYAKYVQTDMTYVNFTERIKAIRYVAGLGAEQVLYFELPGKLNTFQGKILFEVNNADASDLFATTFS